MLVEPFGAISDNTAFRIPAPFAVLTRPLTPTAAAVGARGVKFQKPEVMAKVPLLIAFPATGCPIVESSVKTPVVLRSPPPATTDRVIAKSPPVCA